jgi:hypothetical protein
MNRRAEEASELPSAVCGACLPRRSVARAPRSTHAVNPARTTQHCAQAAVYRSPARAPHWCRGAVPPASAMAREHSETLVVHVVPGVEEVARMVPSTPPKQTAVSANDVFKVQHKGGKISPAKSGTRSPSYFPPGAGSISRGRMTSVLSLSASDHALGAIPDEGRARQIVGAKYLVRPISLTHS